MRNTKKSNPSQRWEYVAMENAPYQVAGLSAAKCYDAQDVSMINMSVIAQESARRLIGQSTKNIVVRLRKKFQQCTTIRSEVTCRDDVQDINMSKV